MRWPRRPRDAGVRGTAAGAGAGAGVAMHSVLRGVQWGLDRMVSVGYGVVYDFVFDHFPPYPALQREILALLAAAVPEAASRRDVRVLEVGCGPGNLTLAIAEAGFTVVGVDAYDGLLEVAREKRRARHLPNLAFRQGDVARGNTFPPGSFDQVVSVHSLYVHPEPARLLAEVSRLLKPGGHAVFVNHTRRHGLGATVRTLAARQGLRAALQALVWVLPNAIFEATRMRVGPHYWAEEEFAARVRAAGFTVLAVRRTFLNDASILVWARKDAEG